MDEFPTTIGDWKTVYETASSLSTLLSRLDHERKIASPAWRELATAEQMQEQWDSLIAASTSAEDAIKNFPLYGVPFAVDNSMDVASFSSSAEDAPMVALLKAAGAIVVGRANLDHSDSAGIVSRGVVAFSLGRNTAGRAEGTLTGGKNIVRLQLTRGTVDAPDAPATTSAPDGVSIVAHSVADAETVLSAVEGLGRVDDGSGCAAGDRLALVVVGAHLSGLPLNGDLLARGARLIEATRTAAAYRLHALDPGPGSGTVRKPGLRRVRGLAGEEEGASIEVEVWSLPSAQLASFMATIPHPLGLGSVELADGTWKLGFICEPVGLQGAQDVTSFGGWQAYLKQLGQ